MVCCLVGGLAGELGAVLQLEELFEEDVFGVVDWPLETVEDESEVGRGVTCVEGRGWWVWSVGIKGVESSVVGVGGATLDGPG